MLGVLLSLLAAVAFALVNILARVALQHIRPTTGAFLSMVASLVLALIVALVFDFQSFISLSLPAILCFAVAGVVGLAGGRFFIYLAISRLGASRGASIAGSAPLLAAVLAVLLLHETVNIAIGIGVLFVVGGIWFLTSGNSTTGKVRRWDYVFPLAAATCFALNNIIVKLAVSSFGGPVAGAPVTIFFAMLVLAIPARSAFNTVTATNMNANRRSTVFIILAGMASSTAMILLYLALNLAPVVIVSPLSNTTPLWTILGAHLFLQRLERVTVRIVLGGLLVVASVAFITIGGA
ncbi:DMT family transporter [Chloroflexota bacterium]